MLGVSHAVEVLVLCLVVVKDSIQQFCYYSSCSCLCHIYSWFLPMSWVLDLSILLSIFVCIYVRLIMSTCSFVSNSLLGISHAIQNDKKLWNLHILMYGNM